MATTETKLRPRASFLLILALAGLLIGGFLVVRFWDHSWLPAKLAEVVAIPPEMRAAGAAVPPAPVGQPAASDHPPTPAKDAAPAEAAGGPRFDVVRVGPDGHAVIAGQAQPGSEVVVRDGADEVARARADSRGGFVALPAEPLKPGGRALSLASRSEGQDEIKGDGSVMLAVPEAQKAGPVAGAVAGSGAASPGAVAVLVPDVGAPRVLQQAPGVQAGPPSNAQSGAQQPGVEPNAQRVPAQGLALDRVDYDSSGAIRFTGAAKAGVTVRLYVDDVVAGSAEADGSGRWTVVPSIDVSAGLHTLRVDALGDGGRVAGRVELPFQRTVMTAAEIAATNGRVVVQPGQNLWRLARTAYGRGVQYTVIYLANQDQIRDPRRIYPGQSFAVPSGRAAGR